MAKVEKAKGNPAHTRMANDHLKTRRAKSWRNSEKRRMVHTAEQYQREQANKKRPPGEPTPWQLASIERRARRLVTCSKCRIMFRDGSCPSCGGSMNLKAAWEKRTRGEMLPAS